MPDFLAQMGGNYFERDGFCFRVLIDRTNNRACQFALYFQNQYERPCVASVCVRPTKTVFVDQSKLKEWRFEIDCGDAAFGKPTADVTVPDELRGQETTWDVTASVRYPQGRGKLLRLRNGLRVGKLGTDQVSKLRQILSVVAALGGHGSTDTPARMQLVLPKIEGKPPGETARDVQVLWTLGDPVDPSNRACQIMPGHN